MLGMSDTTIQQTIPIVFWSSVVILVFLFAIVWRIRTAEKTSVLTDVDMGFIGRAGKPPESMKDLVPLKPEHKEMILSANGRFKSGLFPEPLIERLASGRSLYVDRNYLNELHASLSRFDEEVFWAWAEDVVRTTTVPGGGGQGCVLCGRELGSGIICEECDAVVGEGALSLYHPGFCLTRDKLFHVKACHRVPPGAEVIYNEPAGYDPCPDCVPVRTAREYQRIALARARRGRLPVVKPYLKKNYVPGEEVVRRARRAIPEASLYRVRGGYKLRLDGPIAREQLEVVA